MMMLNKTCTLWVPRGFALWRAHVTGAALLACLALASPAHAINAVVSADFNDNSLGALDGQFGGVGFDAADDWSTSGPGNPTLFYQDVVSGDLVAPLSTNYSIPQTSGVGLEPQHIRSDGGGNMHYRLLDQPLSVGVRDTWFSFLFNLDGGATTRAGIGVDFTGNGDRILFRDPDQDVFVEGTGGIAALTISTGVDHLVIGHIDDEGGNDNGGGDIRDKLSLWLDPDVTSLGAADAVFTHRDWDENPGVLNPVHVLEGINAWGVSVYGSGTTPGSGIYAHLDHLRIADSLNAQDVILLGAAPVPEPTSLALLVVGAIAMALGVRRRV